MTNRNEFREKDMAKAALLYVQAQAEIDALEARVIELEGALLTIANRGLFDWDTRDGTPPPDVASIVFEARAALGSKP